MYLFINSSLPIDNIIRKWKHFTIRRCCQNGQHRSYYATFMYPY